LRQKKKKVLKGPSERAKLTCSFCGKVLFVDDGDWVITINRLTYCHSIEDSCLVKHMELRRAYGQEQKQKRKKRKAKKQMVFS